MSDNAHPQMPPDARRNLVAAINQCLREGVKASEIQAAMADHFEGLVGNMGGGVSPSQFDLPGQLKPRPEPGGGDFNE